MGPIHSRAVCHFVMARGSLKKTLEQGFIGHWYTNLHMCILLTTSLSNFAAFYRGGPPGTKCPMQISYFVLVYNFVNQEPALPPGQEVENPNYDFWTNKPARQELRDDPVPQKGAICRRG